MDNVATSIKFYTSFSKIDSTYRQAFDFILKNTKHLFTRYHLEIEIIKLRSDCIKQLMASAELSADELKAYLKIVLDLEIAIIGLFKNIRNDNEAVGLNNQKTYEELYYFNDFKKL